jgi:SOS response regulatory protein OraA/RecX
MDAYTLALTWLSRRELSTRQVRERLARRDIPSDEIDRAIERLTTDRSLSDRRVALAAARTDVNVRGRGRRRVLYHLQQIGIDRETDEAALLDQAIERSLRGREAASLDRNGIARIVRRLVGQGFEPGAIYARLRRKGPESAE